MDIEITTPKQDLAALATAADAAGRQIPPLWPLASSIAVNPYLGQTGETLAATSARLTRIGGVPVTMERAWYQERIAAGEITDDDLTAALAACPHDAKPRDLGALRDAAAPRPARRALPTIADLAAEASGIDWPALLADRIGAWASSHFDQGQALWTAPRGHSAWEAFRSYATHDLTAEIMGLDGFARHVFDAGDSPLETLARAVRRLGLEPAARATYFHQLLLSLGGWAQYARYELWRAELAGDTDRTITDLLAIRLLWEEALYARYETAIRDRWEAVHADHAAPVTPSADDIVDEVLQEAAERAAQRGLAATLAAPTPIASDARATLQAFFCIDVRSEVFRRALEAVDPAIRTGGFAGFFAVFAKHRRFASDVEELRLPGLLNPTVTSCSGQASDTEKELATRYALRAKRAWGRFKLAAVSSFAFVEAMGPVYIQRLIRDALKSTAVAPPNDPTPRFEPELDLATRIASAETALRAMSLTSDFARIVLFAGHGASVVNNPHASGLQCGACCGYSGEVNARLLALLLNDEAVRKGLVERGIEVPADTLFVGAYHDTTTDEVTLYDRDTTSPEHADDLVEVRQWLAAAGKVCRGERALHLPRAASSSDVAARARDWAEVRPEWGLAGCKAFIAAPRRRTAGRKLEGRAFLHDYDWHQDAEQGFGILELIMTAPVVVASWISLQYYGSTVAPEAFGSGNKLLHNVTGGMGVFEGNGGLLRAGLPWQSVHDGARYIHEPLRLSVVIEAPIEAMTAILEKHGVVRDLFDNRWLHLFAMDDTGAIAHRYAGNLEWTSVADEHARFAA